jgi:hypothetical protein
MVRRWRVLTGMAVGGTVVVGLAVPFSAAGFTKPTAAQVRPHAFGSCASLVGYAQSHFSQTHGLPEPPIAAVNTPVVASPGKATATAPSVAGSAAATADGGGGSPSYSTTNNQEEGVDEPDIVKTNGSTIFTIAQSKLVAVAIEGNTPRIAGTLDLGAASYGAQLLMRGNRLIVISTASPAIPFEGPVPQAAASLRASPYYRYGATTLLSEVDIHDPAAMKVTQTMTIDGTFVDARQSGTSARIVISSAPYVLAKPLLATASKGWVPSWKFKDRRTGRAFVRQVAPCTSIRRPVDFSGLGMMNIVTVNFDRGLGAAPSDSLMADAQIVYGSQSSLYLATQKWVDPRLSVADLPPAQTTVIDRFDVSDPDTTTFVSSGEVPGYLLNQFSLSESGPYVRVASTSRPIWWGVDGGAVPVSQSYVTVLNSAGPVMAPVGQVSGLGQGEQIYSVRFVDDTAYVVTYRQVDPLYTIDLSKPTAPRVAGQLDLEGYSAYLHPVGDGLILGIGVDVSPANNEPSGAQLELFDVSNAAAPKLLAKTTLGAGSSSQVTYDHHAFLYWPATNLAVLPVQIYGWPIAVTPGQPTPVSQQFVGAIGYKVTASGISELGRLVQDAVDGSVPAIQRSLVIGDQLFTISDRGLMASSLDKLTRQAFVAFPSA